MIETGIFKMDTFLQGGIPKGKSLVYYTQPGIDCEIFGLHTIYNTLKNGGKCVFIVNSTTPKNIRDKFMNFGWSIDNFYNNFLFVDAFSYLIGDPSNEKFIISNHDGIEEINKKISDLLSIQTSCTVVFESLSNIMDLYGEKETIKAVKGWNELAKLNGHVLIYNFTAWAYSQESLNLIKNQLFNAVITACGIGEHVIFGKYLGIYKMDWNKETDKFNRFESESIKNKGITAPWLEYEINGPHVNFLGEKYAFEYTSIL